jgi:uncharacterized protein (DUF2164 family)
MPSTLKLTPDQKVEAIRLLQQYLRDEHDFELGDLGTELLLEFVTKITGPISYNEAVNDARAIAADRAETIQEELLGLTRGVELRRPSEPAG